jgi:hypothetical protein
MKLYRIGGRELIVHEDRLFIELEDGDHLGDTNDIRGGQQTPRRYVKKNNPAKLRYCKKCGKPGHRSDGRPTSESHESGKSLTNMTVSELKESIQNLKSEGKTSVEIAKELNCTLTLVNRYW